jgi:hypothetical protein
MRMFSTALLAGVLILGYAGSAEAFSHSAVARAETKAMLSSAIEKACAVGMQTCAVMRKIAADLYKDPSVVTNEDLVRVDSLKDLFAKSDALLKVRLDSVRVDLSVAIDKAEMVTAHVFYIHQGRWILFEVCDMPS